MAQVRLALVCNHDFCALHARLNFTAKRNLVLCGVSSHHSTPKLKLIDKLNYSRLSLSRIPRDSLKHFEISVPRHIRVERVRKTIKN